MLPEWYDKAKELFLKGFNYTEIGKEIGVNRKQVGFYLKENGYISKSPLPQSKKPWRKYTFNESFFEVIDSEEKAYWLGLLYADGYVSEKKTSVELGLKEDDKTHLEKLKASINSNHKLTETIKKLDGKEYIGYRITLNSQKLKDDLIDKGCGPRKTLRIDFPSNDIVPEYLMRHFMRGYADGDACIYIRDGKVSFQIVGTYDFLKQFIKETGLHENSIHYINNRKTVCRVMYGGLYAIKIMKMLYDNSTIYLDRKYALVEACMPSQD